MKRILQKIKYVGWILYFLAAAYALRYQTDWRETQISGLYVKQAMEENGDGEHARELLREATCFPVKKDASGQVYWSFEDGYGGVRTYGGNRKHEGIDVMASVDRPGCLQICAAADGVVEQMGWLKLGGYRIGIRSRSGMYYYYAHLERYSDGLQVGGVVKAGDVIGTMGNTGYGPEKTTGKFPVHLHFGVYVKQDGGEQSMNPYPILQYLEKHGQKTGK